MTQQEQTFSADTPPDNGPDDGKVDISNAVFMVLATILVVAVISLPVLMQARPSPFGFVSTCSYAGPLPVRKAP